MRSCVAVVCAAALATTLAARDASAQHPMVTLPLDDPAYEQLNGLWHMGCAAAHLSAFRPYQAGAVRKALATMQSRPRCAGPLLDALVARFGTDTAAVPPEGSGITGGFMLSATATALGDREFRPLWRGARPDEEGTPALVGTARARLTWNGGEHVIAVLEGYAVSDRRNDPTLRGRGFRQTDAVVDVGDSYLNARIGPLTASIGRSADAWLGHGRESMVLSAHGPMLDRVALDAAWSRLEARALFASINDVVLTSADGLDSGITPQRVHRFLAAHALTYRVKPSWEITVGETALLTRRGGGVDLAFINPAMLFVVAENDSSHAGAASDDNNLTAFAATRFSSGPASVASELVIDDIQIDSKDRKNLPDQLAWRVLGTLSLPVTRPAALSLEYRRVGSFTYLRDSYAEVYQQYDQPIGSELGPDADMFRAGAQLWPNGRMRLSAGISRWRRGARRIDARPAEGAFGHADEPFPSVSPERPAAQRAWIGDGGVELLDATFTLRAGAELARIENLNNTPTAPSTFLRAHITGSYRFRYP